MKARTERSVSTSSIILPSGVGIHSSSKDNSGTYVINKEKLRGDFLFQGVRGKITVFIISLPWKMWWQVTLIVSVILNFIIILLIISHDTNSLVYMLLAYGIELAYFVDVLVHLVHLFWPLLRYHIRVYRRNPAMLVYDTVSLIPFTVIFTFGYPMPSLVMLGRLMAVGRIYKIFGFYQIINEALYIPRQYIYMIEQVVTVTLMMHAATCAWYGLHNPEPPITRWSESLGYPSHVKMDTLTYNSYANCCYYATCHIFNIVFGDGFPLNHPEKLITSAIMIVGFVFIRYEFIGTLAFELVTANMRRSIFVDKYHHMLRYLKFRGAPPELIELAKQFKLHLWNMNDGVLTSEHLHKLPVALQLEFIFDINVLHLHNTIVFRHQSEAILRHISLLMKHELYLPGQQIWAQGVVKTGLLCVKQGVIEMLSDEDDESPMVAFKEGTILGEVSLFYSIPSKVTVRAATYVELQVLHRTDFMRIMVEHQGMLGSSRKIIEERVARNKKRQKAIEEYDKGDLRLLRTQYRPMKILRDRLLGTEEEDPTFVDDSHMYYRDEHNILQPKFTEEYFELYEITRNVTTIDKPRIFLRSSFPWILEPDTDLIQLFNCIHFFIVLYICLTTPYKLIDEPKSDYEKIMDTVVFAGLLFNIYTQCTTAIFKKKSHKVTVKEIVEEKMATVGFYLDLLSIFPMHIFTTTISAHYESIADQIFLIFPMLQVWHLWSYVNAWEQSFNSNRKLLCVMKYFLIIVIFSYWAGCLLYIISCPKGLCRKSSWMTQLIHWETKVLITIKARHEQRFFTAVAFGVSVFTGSGSDIGPGSSDLILVMFIFMLGSYLICFYFAKICSLYLLSTQRKHKFKEAMRELFYFLTVNHVGSKITARVKKFFSVQWYYNNAVNTEELFENVSSKIQQEVRSIEMEATLLCCPLFQNCSLDFLQTLATNIRTIVLPDNEIVQHLGDIGRDMYILQMGHCNVMDQSGQIMFTIGPGDSVGDVEMMFGLPKVYTVLTSTNCIFLYLEYSSLEKSWGPFPDVCEPILTVLGDKELKKLALAYEDARQMTGRMVIKTNKIKQELKESFVLQLGEKKKSYNEEFKRLGIMRHLRYIFIPGCITPYGVFLKFWCGVRFFAAFYYILVIPYNLATRQHKHIGLYHWMDLVMYVDLFIMGYVAYYNDKNLLITHPLLTVTKYLKGAFLLDLISVMPIEHLVLIVNENTDIDMCRLNRMLLVFRITGAFSYWEDNIMQVNQAVSLLKFLPLTITIVNIMTSLVYANSCVSYMKPSSTFMFVNCSKSVLTNIDTTTTTNQYALQEYAYTFYWLFEVFIGCGCTSVLISKKLDVLFCMILQVFSVLYFAFMCGHVSSTRSAAAHRLLHHTEKARDLANFLYQQNVDPALTAKTLKYFEYVWKRTHGSNPQQICRCLNSALMEDTLVFMYEKALREVPLFGKVDRSFIRVITQHLNEMYVLKGETIIQYMDVQQNVFIIYRGKVDVLNSYNEMITCMGPGGMFGNFSGQPISCSEVTIFASRSLDLLVLPSQTFLNVIKYYPKIQEPLNKAFEASKNYILPISMDFDFEDTSSSDSELEERSFESISDNKSASSRLDMPFFTAGQISLHSSQSSLNRSRSNLSHALSFRASFHPSNLVLPGSELLLGYGYLLCWIVTINYSVILYQLVTLNDWIVLFWFHAFFDIWFYVKVCLEMHQGFINKHGELILSGVKCRRRYFKLKLKVWTDVIANFPLEFFGFIFASPLTAMHYFRANKLLRLKYLLEFYKNTASELTNDLTLLQLAMTAIIVILSIHTLSCIWLIVLTAKEPISSLKSIKMQIIDEETPIRLWDYTTALYLIVADITATGAEELVIDSGFPMLLSAASMMSGKILSAIVVATSIQVANSRKFALVSYESKIGKLIDMLKNQGLSDHQESKFWTYVRQLWVSERGRQLPGLLKQTPYVRKCDLMSAMFGQHLRNSFLFNGTGEAFLRQVTAALEYTIYFPGNYIVVAGETESRMHWVESGVVAVVSVRADLTETTHELLHDGDVFGVLQGLQRGVSHCFTYKAQSKACILTLSLDSWVDFLPFFPEAQRLIRERIEILFTKI